MIVFNYCWKNNLERYSKPLMEEIEDLKRERHTNFLRSRIDYARGIIRDAIANGARMPTCPVDKVAPTLSLQLYGGTMDNTLNSVRESS